MEKEPHRYYVPIGKGEKFINLLGEDKYLVVLFSAANGVGKTHLGANMLANIIWHCDNPYFQHEVFKNWKYPKRIRIVSDTATILGTTIPKMKEVFPKGRFNVEKYETTKEGKHFEARWKTDTGWEIDVMTYEQDVKQFESATVGLVWLDEPPPREIYKACVARLRMGGMMMITETPLTEAWLYDEILTNPDNEKGYRAFVEADVEDACKEHGERGFLSHEQIEKLIAQYDPEERQARVFGKFQHLTGLVFKNWRHDIHIIEPFQINKRDFVVVEAYDTHPRNPESVMWVAIDRKGTKYIIDELYRDADVEQMALSIKDVARDYRIIKRILEPAAFVVDKRTGYSVASDLSQRGLTYHEASKRRTDAIKRTRRALNFVASQDHIIKPPELYVFNNCRRTIYEFEHWQWENWRGKIAQYKDPREKPMDKDDHMMENIGRILLEELVFEELVEEKYQPSLPKLDPYA